MTLYIIKSSISLLLMFGLYWFLLRKEKLFVFNRFFLVVSVMFSLLVPFISISTNIQVTPKLYEIIPTYNYVNPEVSIEDNIATSSVNINQPYLEKKNSVISISAILIVFYFAGVILLLIRFLRNIYLIIRRSKLSEKISFKGYQIVLTNDKAGPCCFFRNIFLNKDDYLNGKIDKELLDHELEHVRQSHTVDIILIELVKIFYWFNPVHLLYERAIRINHEYLADNGVINENSDIKSYTNKMLSFISCSSNMSLTSSSNNSFTKMRLIMMMKSRSRSFIYVARITITLFMVTFFFLLLSFKESEQEIFTRVEIMPEYPGGDEALMQFINQNMRYPEEAKAKEIEGRILVRFVITMDGNTINPEVLKSIDPLLDAEALRVVNLMKGWKPGMQGGKPVNVWYNVPVTFALLSETTNIKGIVEGVSTELMGEYKNIVNKYRREITNDSLNIITYRTSPEKNGVKDFFSKISFPDKERLATIFFKMNKEQQEEQIVSFYPIDPNPKIVPTKEQFESFKDQNTYGISINYKKVSNEVLKNYTHTDFSYVAVGKAMIDAAVYGKPVLGVHLLTNGYYQTYNEMANTRKIFIMGVSYRKGLSYAGMQNLEKIENQ